MGWNTVFIQNFDGETFGKQSIGRSSRRWSIILKHGMEKQIVRMESGLNCLLIYDSI
jgi:hypothetical protein